MVLHNSMFCIISKSEHEVREGVRPILRIQLSGCLQLIPDVELLLLIVQTIAITIEIALHDRHHDCCLVPLILCSLVFYVVLVTQNCWAGNCCFLKATNEIAGKVKCSSLIGYYRKWVGNCW